MSAHFLRKESTCCAPDGCASEVRPKPFLHPWDKLLFFILVCLLSSPLVMLSVAFPHAVPNEANKPQAFPSLGLCGATRSSLLVLPLLPCLCESRTVRFTVARLEGVCMTGLGRQRFDSLSATCLLPSFHSVLRSRSK